MNTEFEKVIKFLLGEGELDGLYFGDEVPANRPNFWWRKHLREAEKAHNQHLRTVLEGLLNKTKDGTPLPPGLDAAQDKIWKQLAKLGDPEFQQAVVDHYSETIERLSNE